MLQKFRSLLPSKLKACGIHFLLSLVIFGVILYVMLFHWYPWPWFALDGGWQGVRIMIWVDLVLGPTLTFLVFNPHKTRLALGFDLSCIAIAQVLALAGGLYLVEIERPLAIVYSGGAFHSADDNSLHKQKLDESALKAYGDRLPVLVYSEPPTTKEGKDEMVRRIFQEGLAPYEQSQLFRPLQPNLQKVFASQDDIQVLAKQVPEINSELDRFLAKHQGSEWQDYRYVQFMGRYEAATLIFTPDGTLVGTLPPKPPVL